MRGPVAIDEFPQGFEFRPMLGGTRRLDRGGRSGPRRCYVLGCRSNPFPVEASNVACCLARNVAPDVKTSVCLLQSHSLQDASICESQRQAKQPAAG